MQQNTIDHYLRKNFVLSQYPLENKIVIQAIGTLEKQLKAQNNYSSMRILGESHEDRTEVVFLTYNEDNDITASMTLAFVEPVPEIADELVVQEEDIDIVDVVAEINDEIAVGTAVVDEDEAQVELDYTPLAQSIYAEKLPAQAINLPLTHTAEAECLYHALISVLNNLRLNDYVWIGLDVTPEEVKDHGDCTVLTFHRVCDRTKEECYPYLQIALEKGIRIAF